MNKTLTPEELKDIVVVFEPYTPPRPLSRQVKLLHWAEAVYCFPYRIEMLHDIEYVSYRNYCNVRTSGTIFEVAAQDPTLKEAGLTSSNLRVGMDFFELSNNDLHWLACDCRGVLDNTAMCHRIEALARSNFTCQRT